MLKCNPDDKQVLTCVPKSQPRALGDSKRTSSEGKTTSVAHCCEALRNPRSFRTRRYVNGVRVSEMCSMFKTVLFPVDQSREAREAAEKVINIVKTYGARLVILSVVEPPAEAGESPPREAMASPEAVAKLLSDAQAMFSQQGIEAEIIEREGKPAFTICDVADEIGADLIVMGCRGMGLTDDGASDSVTSRVINLSPCAVLIVP
jgi:nucleotide-binding universal stress UspA family protein